MQQPPSPHELTSQHGSPLPPQVANVPARQTLVESAPDIPAGTQRIDGTSRQLPSRHGAPMLHGGKYAPPHSRHTASAMHTRFVAHSVPTGTQVRFPKLSSCTQPDTHLLSGQTPWPGCPQPATQ